jgi:hypothetical protein
MPKPVISPISALWDDERALAATSPLPPTLDGLLAKISAMALDLLSDNHPDVDPASHYLQITALREAEPAVGWYGATVRQAVVWIVARRGSVFPVLRRHHKAQHVGDVLGNLVSVPSQRMMMLRMVDRGGRIGDAILASIADYGKIIERRRCDELHRQCWLFRPALIYEM